MKIMYKANREYYNILIGLIVFITSWALFCLWASDSAPYHRNAEDATEIYELVNSSDSVIADSGCTFGAGKQGMRLSYVGPKKPENLWHYSMEIKGISVSFSKMVIEESEENQERYYKGNQYYYSEYAIEVSELEKDYVEEYVEGLIKDYGTAEGKDYFQDIYIMLGENRYNLSMENFYKNSDKELKNKLYSNEKEMIRVLVELIEKQKIKNEGK